MRAFKAAVIKLLLGFSLVNANRKYGVQNTWIYIVKEKHARRSVCVKKNVVCLSYFPITNVLIRF